MADKKDSPFQKFIMKKGAGVDAKKGLAGSGNYKGPLGYKDAPSQGFAKTKPLPYANKDNPEDRDVIYTAQDDDNKVEPLGDQMTPGMDKATSLGEKPNEKLIKMVPKPKRLTNEDFEVMASTMPASAMLAKASQEMAPNLTQVMDLFGNPFTPEPNQTIEYVVRLMANSPRMLDRFIICLKNCKMFEDFLNGMMRHKECFDSMANTLNYEDGDKKAIMLAQALNAHDDESEDEGMEESVKHEKKTPADKLFEASVTFPGLHNKMKRVCWGAAKEC